MTVDPFAMYLSIDDVFAIHEQAIRLHGGDKSPHAKSGCVESSLGAAWSAECYSVPEAEMPGLCFAGHVLFYLAKNHCFVDGNKRIAWACCMEALRNLGLTILATDDEAEDFCVGMLDGSSAIEKASDVFNWLVPRLCAIENSSTQH